MPNYIILVDPNILLELSLLVRRRCLIRKTIQPIRREKKEIDDLAEEIAA